MKKWLKINYKYYLFFFIVIIYIVISNMMSSYSIFTDVEILPDGRENINYICKEIMSVTTDIRTLFFGVYSKLLILGYIILHAVMLWGQRNRSEREFLETLPFKKELVVAYRAIIEIALLIIAVAISVAANYIYVCDGFKKYDVKLDCLFEAMAGMGMTLICYIVMILGIMYFIEALVVRGDLKIISTVGSLAVIYLSINTIYEAVTYGKKCLFNDIFACLKLYSAGGCVYSINDYTYGTNANWITNNFLYDFTYAGTEHTVSTMNGAGYLSGQRSMIGFKNIELWVGYALSYFLIGTILIGLGILLTKLQDISKQGFYFKFAGVLAGVLIFTGIFTIMLQSQVWYIALLFGFVGVGIAAYFMKVLCRQEQ